MIDRLMRRKLKQKYGLEKVLVADRNATKDIPDLFTKGVTSSVFDASDLFIKRYDAEYSDVFVQLIPYTVIVNKQGDKVYTTKRIGGEERLLNEYSLGIGGHVNPKDYSKDTMLTAAEREILEELNITLLEVPKRFGTVRDLNSTTNDHLGLVYRTKASYISVKEKNKLEGRWMSYGDLVTNYEHFESWSRYIIDYMFSTTKDKKKLFQG